MNSGRILRRLLRLALIRAAAAGDRWSGRARNRRHEDALARAARAIARCRRALAEAQAERKARVADLLRYGKAREALIAREAAEPPGAGKDAVRRSLATLEERLVAWLDELDALDARIAGLEADLAFLTGTASGARENGPDETAGPETAATNPDAERARQLAALGLGAMPASLVELKAAYRARLKAVHPDVGAQASTDATAAATVAFAELRRHFVQS